jgi:hypothetical protein
LGGGREKSSHEKKEIREKMVEKGREKEKKNQSKKIK